MTSEIFAAALEKVLLATLRRDSDGRMVESPGSEEINEPPQRRPLESGFISGGE